MERVRFVVKGGMVVRNDLGPGHPRHHARGDKEQGEVAQTEADRCMLSATRNRQGECLEQSWRMP